MRRKNWIEPMSTTCSRRCGPTKARTSTAPSSCCRKRRNRCSTRASAPSSCAASRGRRSVRTSTSCVAKEDVATLRYPQGGARRAAETVKSFEMPPGFTAAVVASEPLINKADRHAVGRRRAASGSRRRPSIRTAAGRSTTDAWKETGVLKPGQIRSPRHGPHQHSQRSGREGRVHEEDRLLRRPGARHRLLPVRRWRDRRRAAGHRFHPRRRRGSRRSSASTPASRRATRTSSRTTSSSRRMAGSTRTPAAARTRNPSRIPR